MLDVGKLIRFNIRLKVATRFSSMLDVLWYNMVSEIVEYPLVRTGSL